MKLRFKLFFQEFLLFGTTLILGLLVAYRYVMINSASPVFQAPSLSLSDIIVLALMIACLILAAKSLRFARAIFWLFLVLIILSGSQIVFSLFLNSPFDLVASLFLLILFFVWRNVLIHDLAIILALAGIGALLGISITPTFGAIVLLALSFYDIIAVYKTRHMVKMAQGMVKSGAIFGFIIPQETKSFFASRNDARAGIGNEFMILGSGDIGLPVIFVSSLMRQSLHEAIFVSVFAVLGVLSTHLLFVNQMKRQAMAALPPIATMCLVGYVLALLFKI